VPFARAGKASRSLKSGGDLLPLTTPIVGSKFAYSLPDTHAGEREMIYQFSKTFGNFLDPQEASPLSLLTKMGGVN